MEYGSTSSSSLVLTKISPKKIPWVSLPPLPKPTYDNCRTFNRITPSAPRCTQAASLGRHRPPHCHLPALTPPALTKAPMKPAPPRIRPISVDPSVLIFIHHKCSDGTSSKPVVRFQMSTSTVITGRLVQDTSIQLIEFNLYFTIPSEFNLNQFRFLHVLVQRS
uniref:Uncharacterized protein n=1 Tax=Triticum urartu TaxID=4572 RepID=A0A8R7QTZ2_TRIUA